MITMIPPGETLGADFTPVAQILVPLHLFAERGVVFATDADDLGDYDYAAIRVEGCGMILLLRYHNTTHEGMDLFLAEDFRGRADLPEILSHLADALVVPPSAFRWRQDGETVSLAPPQGRAAA